MPRPLGSEEKAAPSSESSKQRELVQFVIDNMAGSNLLIEAMIRDDINYEQSRLRDKMRQLQEINHAVIERVRGI